MLNYCRVKEISEIVDAGHTPGDLCGPLGSGGGSLRTIYSPPPTDLPSGLFARGGRRAQSSSSRGRAATPPECGDSHALSSSLVLDDPVRAKYWDGAVGARGGRGAATYQFGRLGNIFGTRKIPFRELRFHLQVFLSVVIRTAILKKSLGQLAECSSPSQPEGVGDGEKIQTHPMTLPY